MQPDSEKIETLRWRDHKLEMIDQRILPAHFEYLAFDSATAVAEGIRSMVVRGAPAIGCAAAYAVALEARRLEQETPEDFAHGLEQAFTILAQSRPTAINLFWALNRMRTIWQSNKTGGNKGIAARIQQRSATFSNGMMGRDAVASEPHQRPRRRSTNGNLQATRLRTTIPDIRVLESRI